jgi:GTP-dependent dephospho-CoA kinase
MAVAYRITPELRAMFKKPFGVLVGGSYAETMAIMAEVVKKELPPMIVSVGDRVSRSLFDFEMNPRVAIIDNKCMRRKIKPKSIAESVVQVRNPKGTITEEAIVAVRAAFEENKHVQIVVDGEEDLLTLVAVLYAPENSLVVYGQPCEGIVIVKVTAEKKAAVVDFLKAMKSVRKAK